MGEWTLGYLLCQPIRETENSWMDKMSSSAEHLTVDLKNKLKLRERNYEEERGVKKYSGTSLKGLSELRTQYENPPY